MKKHTNFQLVWLLFCAIVALALVFGGAGSWFQVAPISKVIPGGSGVAISEASSLDQFQALVSGLGLTILLFTSILILVSGPMEFKKWPEKPRLIASEFVQAGLIMFVTGLAGTIMLLGYYLFGLFGKRSN